MRASRPRGLLTSDLAPPGALTAVLDKSRGLQNFAQFQPFCRMLQLLSSVDVFTEHALHMTSLNLFACTRSFAPQLPLCQETPSSCSSCSHWWKSSIVPMYSANALSASQAPGLSHRFVGTLNSALPVVEERLPLEIALHFCLGFHTGMLVVSEARLASHVCA